MIDEKILITELKTEYKKTLALFNETRNELFAAELNALDTVMKIVKSQKKIREDLDALSVDTRIKQSNIPKYLFDEWDSVVKPFRR